MTVKVVVARWTENMDWTKKLNNVLIYTKGRPEDNNGAKYTGYYTLDSNYNTIYTKNVGREGHTFYKYIYDNYDNLEDHTVFLQGNPFPHGADQQRRCVISKIQDWQKNKNLKLDFELVAETHLWSNTGLDPHHDIPIADVYKRLFNVNPLDQKNHKKSNFDFIFGAGGQFIVSKKNILKRSRDFYLKIVKMLENNINPMEGYPIERLHPVILGNYMDKGKIFPK